MKKIIISIVFGLLIIPASNTFATEVCPYTKNSDLISGLSCTSEADYLKMKQEVTGLYAQNTAIYNHGGMTGSSFANQSDPVIQDRLNSCLADWDTHIQRSITRDICLEKQKKLLIQNISTEEYVNAGMQDYCEEKYGDNVLYNSQKKNCECKNSYLYDKNSKTCLPEAELLQASCENTYGINSISDISTRTCYCKSGYQMTGDPKSCVPTSTKSMETILGPENITCANIDSKLALLGVTNINDITKAKAGLGCNTVSPVKIDEPVINKKVNTEVLSKPESPKPLVATSSLSENSSSTNSVSSTPTTTVATSTETTPKKISWFRKFINWFR